MTKQVHKREMVAHLWAHKAQDTARVAGGNFRFTGATLYSYGPHFVCAHHLPAEYNRDGRALALFNAGRYSMTTGRHMDAAWRALPGSIDRVDVPGLDENMVRGISRYGCGEVVAALLAQLRTLADKAANPRIRPDTRGALFSQLRDIRADALHLATCDKARGRDLPDEKRADVRRYIAELSPEVPTEGADKAGAVAYAFAMNRGMYETKMRDAIARARRCIASAAYNVECGNYATARHHVQDAERCAAGAREFADKARRKLPRDFAREMKARAAGSEWRDTLETKARAEDVAAAIAEWRDGEALAREALAGREFYIVDRALCGDFRRAFETLHGEPGDAERREFVAMLERERNAWRGKNETEKAREHFAAARELFNAGKFNAAESAAYNARNAMQRANNAPGVAFDNDTIAEVIALAERAAERKPEEFAAMLADWRDAKPGARFPSELHNRDRAAFLRLSADGRRVETSQGAEVPARVCAVLWPMIGECKRGGFARTFPGGSDPGAVRLGHFLLDSIDAEGNVRAGCHFIRYSELANIAGRLNFAPHN